MPNLEDVANTLLLLVENAANSDSLNQLEFDDTKGEVINAEDLKNVLFILDFLLARVTNLPPGAAEAFSLVGNITKAQAEALTQADLTDPDIQAQAIQISGIVVGAAIAMDFFNDDYPEQEAFLDQTFVSSGNVVASEPMPSLVPGYNAPSTLPSFSLVPHFQTAPPSISQAPQTQKRTLLPTALPSISLAPTAQGTTDEPTQPPTTEAPQAQQAKTEEPVDTSAAFELSRLPTILVTVLCGSFVASRFA